MTTPATEQMTAAELRVVREYLGLTTRWLADHLGVAERSVHRWESGEWPVPGGVSVEVERLEAATADRVGAAVEACHDARDPAILTYRTDQLYRRHHPHVGPGAYPGPRLGSRPVVAVPWPAAWHRAVVARVAQGVPGLVIDYWEGVHS